MAIGYTWDVSTVDTYPTLDSNADVVYNVHWRLTAEDDANQDADGNNWTASSYGTQSVDTADITDFTSFADLTSSDVQAWVETAMGEEAVTASSPIAVSTQPCTSEADKSAKLVKLDKSEVSTD